MTNKPKMKRYRLARHCKTLHNWTSSVRRDTEWGVRLARRSHSESFHSIWIILSCCCAGTDGVFRIKRGCFSPKHMCEQSTAPDPIFCSMLAFHSTPASRNAIGV